MLLCVEGASAASSRVTPNLKNGVPRDDLKNGRGCVWAVPQQRHSGLSGPLGSQKCDKNPKRVKNNQLGARLRGRTATQRPEKGSEKVLGRVRGKGFSEGF